MTTRLRPLMGVITVHPDCIVVKRACCRITDHAASVPTRISNHVRSSEYRRFPALFDMKPAMTILPVAPDLLRGVWWRKPSSTISALFFDLTFTLYSFPSVKSEKLTNFKTGVWLFPGSHYSFWRLLQMPGWALVPDTPVHESGGEDEHVERWFGQHTWNNQRIAIFIKPRILHAVLRPVLLITPG